MKLNSLYPMRQCFRFSSMHITSINVVQLPNVGVVNRRGEYKTRIYSDLGQYPASRGIGKTGFHDSDTTFSSQYIVTKSLDLVIFCAENKW